MPEKRISVIIPTLNEEAYVESTLNNLLYISPSAYEIIGVDGGSTDQTLNIFKKFNVKTYQSDNPSRSIQMNLGAKYASGDILVFLHADTTLPSDIVKIVSNYMEDKKVVLGGFVAVITGYKKRLIFSALNFVKTWLWTFFINPKRFLFNGLKIIFGDQVMFCRKKDFDKISGFNEKYRILEDAELCLRMNRLGKIKQFPENVFTSDRRIAKQGSLKALWVYSFICFLWTLGYPAEKLAKYYKNIR